MTSEMFSLYAITDRKWLKEKTLENQVKEVLKGGATTLQLREKTLSFDDFLEYALKLKPICQKYKVPFIINDRVDIAIAADADGVHVGQSDQKAQEVRELLPPEKILGVSCTTVDQALKAQHHGADYLGVGTMFPTETKADAETASFDTLIEIVKAVSIPVVAIGGIRLDNVHLFKKTGIDGVAVISSIFATDDVQRATRQLKEEVNMIL